MGKNGSQHLNYLAKKNTWADEFIIQGLTSLFSISLCLISPDSKPVYYSWGEKPSSKVIYMFYFPGLHFQLLHTALNDSTLNLILDAELSKNFERTKTCLFCKKLDENIILCKICRYFYHANGCLMDHGCIIKESILPHPSTNVRSTRMTRNYRESISSIKVRNLEEIIKNVSNRLEAQNKPFHLWTTEKSFN